MQFSILIELSFSGSREARIIFNSVKQEIQSEDFTRSKSKLLLKNEKIILDVKARDKTALKASLNNYLKSINLSFSVLSLNGGARNG